MMDCIVIKTFYTDLRIVSSSFYLEEKKLNIEVMWFTFFVYKFEKFLVYIFSVTFS